MSAQIGIAFIGKLRVVGSVLVLDPRSSPSIGQQEVTSVLTDGFEQPIARPVARREVHIHERLVHQAYKQRGNVSFIQARADTHSLGSL